MTHWREFLDPSAPSGGYLPWKEVARRTSLSRTTAWRLQRRGEFPRPYSISPGRVGHLECEVEAWVVSRARAERQSRPIPGASAVAATPSARNMPLPVVTAPSTSRDAMGPAAPPEPLRRAEASRRPRRACRTAGKTSPQITFNF